MRGLTNSQAIQMLNSKRIKPKQFNHSNIRVTDDFKKNAKNGVILRKQTVKACINGTWEVV